MMLVELDNGFAKRGGGPLKGTTKPSRWDGSTIPISLGAVEHSIALLAHWLDQRRAILERDCPAEAGAVASLNKSIASRIVSLAMLAKRGIELPAIDDPSLRTLIAQATARLRQPDQPLDEVERERLLTRNASAPQGCPLAARSS
jgi:hypothetical protein